LLPFLAVLLAVAAGCGRVQPRHVGPPKKVSIGVSTWPASAALYVASEEAFFRDAGLDVNLVPYASGHLALADALSGTVDFATATETPIAAAVLAGKPVVIVATLAHVDRAVVIVGRLDRGVTVDGGLAGKKVGVTRGTNADFFLHTYLVTSYVNPTDVTIVDVPTDRLVESLAAGEIDAACTWEPYASAAQNRLGADAVVVRDPELYTMTWNLAASRERVLRDPEVAVRLLKAVIAANAFIANHAAESEAIVAREVGMDVALVRKGWPDCELTADLDQELVLCLEDEARWLGRRSGQPVGSADVLEHIYVDGLRQVRPEAVQIAGMRGTP
jgi:ABC-type nitrate/sulfonate/bicarbonate transport system substrate-binding protein